MTEKELQQEFYNYFIQYYPHNSVCGKMGNISNECDWRPNLEEVGGGGGWGLIQWTGQRRTNLINFYGRYPTIEEQFEYIRFEIEGLKGVEKQWIDAKGYTLKKFKAGEYSPSESALAFCWCFERPGAPDLDKRTSEAERFAKIMSNVSTNNNIIEKAVQWMINIANDDSHGYDQNNRWGSPDYDCSSLVISAYTQAGIDVKSAGASYTGNMKEVFVKKGFEVIHLSDWTDTSQMKRGDVLLNEIHHTAVYIGDGKIVQASINELGTATGGQPGDQTGKEIYVGNYYVYSKGWDLILRLPSSIGGSGGGTTEEVTDSNLIEIIDKYSIPSVYSLVNSYRPEKLRNLSESQINTLKTAIISCPCHMKHTWDRNKRRVGVSFHGGHLTFSEKQYIIENVGRDGRIKLTRGNGSQPNFLNPNYICLSEEDKHIIIEYVKEYIKEMEDV